MNRFDCALVGGVVWLAVVLQALGAAPPSGGAAELNAREIQESLGTDRGICAILGEPAAQAVIDLARATGFILFVQSPDAQAAAELRPALDRAGLLGTRIYVDSGSLDRVHLADNLADGAIVLPGAALADAELLRILHPGARALLPGRALEKPWPEGIDAWSHPYHGPDNNPQSSDQLARAPYLTQFLGEPWFSPMPEVSVAAGGRIFKAFGHIAMKEREWPWVNTLVAINAFNGTTLWKRDLAPGFMIHRNTLIATDKVVYLGDDSSCKLLDSGTGKLLGEIVVPRELADGPVWKWMALQDGILYALVGEKEPFEEPLRGRRVQSGWPWNELGQGYDPRRVGGYSWGFGRTLLAIDPASRQVLWSHREEEPLDARAMCMNAERIFCYSHQRFLACFYARTGAELWRTSDSKLLAAIGAHNPAQNPRLGFASTSYTKCTPEILLFAGPQRDWMVAASAQDGKLLWDYPHGNFQVIFRDGALYAMARLTTSKKLDPLTGKVLADLDCYRGNCTRATGTIDSIFTRGHLHTGTMRLAIEGNSPRRIGMMRPACQDGVIAAAGLLYWGPWMCDCNHSLVGLICLGPAGDFRFGQGSTDSERLERADRSEVVASLPDSPGDWPTYRSSNQRAASSASSVPLQVTTKWQYQPPAAIDPAAPIAVADLVFVSGSDGIVRALEASSGTPRWTAYTGGPITYPPSVWEGRLYVGSGDGWIHALEAKSGRRLWRFRAAPIERRIVVHGTLSSTWPVASGVLVENGIVYAAAGIASYDGTHVYALDARTGKIVWQNHESGDLLAAEETMVGVSVQGHLLLHRGRLCLAGGNVVSPAIYDAATGRCLNTLEDEWTKAPRGSELFLVGDEVQVNDQPLYSPRGYIPSRYFPKYFLQAAGSEIEIRGTDTLMVRIDPATRASQQPTPLWSRQDFVRTAAVVLASNAVLVTSRLAKQPDSFALSAIDATDGKTLWSQPLPAAPDDWGLAVDRAGRILVTLQDGRLWCFDKP